MNTSSYAGAQGRAAVGLCVFGGSGFCFFKTVPAGLWPAPVSWPTFPSQREVRLHCCWSLYFVSCLGMRTPSQMHVCLDLIFGHCLFISLVHFGTGLLLSLSVNVVSPRPLVLTFPSPGFLFAIRWVVLGSTSWLPHPHQHSLGLGPLHVVVTRPP